MTEITPQSITIQKGQGITQALLELIKKQKMEMSDGSISAAEWNATIDKIVEIQESRKNDNKASIFTGGTDRTSGKGNFVVNPNQTIEFTKEEIESLYKAMGVSFGADSVQAKPEDKPPVKPENTPQTKPENNGTTPPANNTPANPNAGTPAAPAAPEQPVVQNAFIPPVLAGKKAVAQSTVDGKTRTEFEDATYVIKYPSGGYEIYSLNGTQEVCDIYSYNNKPVKRIINPFATKDFRKEEAIPAAPANKPAAAPENKGTDKQQGKTTIPFYQLEPGKGIEPTEPQLSSPWKKPATPANKPASAPASQPAATPKGAFVPPSLKGKEVVKTSTVGDKTRTEFKDGTYVIKYKSGGYEVYLKMDHVVRTVVEAYSYNNRLSKYILYDKDGKVIESYEYDAAGHMTKDICYDKDGKVTKSYEYEYDAAGNITKDIYYDKDGKVTQSYKYEYYAPLHKKKSIHCDKDGKVVSIEEFDKDGNVTKKTEYDANGKEIK